MAKSVFKSILVIGNNHEQIVKSFSADTKVEPYVYMGIDDAPKKRKADLKFLENLINNKTYVFDSYQKDIFGKLYRQYAKMTDFEYFVNKATEYGCVFNEENGDAMTDKNPNTFYCGEKCYQKSFLATGEEAPCVNPFKLKNGTMSYSAKKGEIDWDLMHMYNTDTYKSVWEMVVDKREPENEDEKDLFESMKNRFQYFRNFENKEDYITRSCAFWTHGVATEFKYYEADFKVSDGEWAKNYFDKFIANIDDDVLLTIYEARNI